MDSDQDLEADRSSEYVGSTMDTEFAAASGETLHALGDDEIELVTHYLRLGRRLPPHLLPRLFEVPREYQLAYAGKLREGDVLVDTMSVPLQPQRSFGQPLSSQQNMLVMGDNLQVLKRLMELKQSGKLRSTNGSDGIKLVYIDPPFATGEAWETRSGRVAYADKVRGAEFIEWLRRRLIMLRQLLADDGSIVVHLDQRYVHYIKVVMDELFPGNFRNEIIVPRGIKGVQSQFEKIDALAQGHYTLLLYSRRPSARYNKLFDEGQKPSRWDTFWLGTNRPTMRYDLFGVTPKSGQWRWSRVKSNTAIKNYERFLNDAPGVPIDQYADAVEAATGERPDFLREGPNGPQWYRYAKFRKLASDVWDVKTKGSATGYPTEKHEDLLDRIIHWLSDKGDIVLDAFVGSGTTVAVAQKLGRHWIGIDTSKYAIYTTQNRLLRATNGKIREAGFTVYNAGLYDYAALKDLPREAYVSFALQLFQCRPKDEVIGGVAFQGMLGDDRVLVVDYHAHPDAQVGYDFVTDLADLCADKLGNRCFIVAPAAAVSLYEDYVDTRGVRFYFLRIPYSVIAELHKRSFTEIRQPTSSKTTNEIVEAVGFDFIQPPSVACEYLRTPNGVHAKILEFESEAFTASPTGGFDDLAMVLVDPNFDQGFVGPTVALFADELRKTDWMFDVSTPSDSRRISVTFMDVFGNEYREAIELAALRMFAGRDADGR
ncbi:MAG: DNA methyltransferase [Mycobacterium sp.]